MVMDISVSFIPLLIIILLKVLMCGMDSKMFTDPTGQLKLFIDFFQKQIILFSDHAVTVAAVAREYLKSYNNDVIIK